MVQSTIIARKPNFELEQGAGGLWNAKLPELSHTLNAFQLALPYLEPYFIDAVRRAGEQVQDGKLKEDVAAFCAQEANHSRQHKQYSKLLQRRYPQLQDFERRIQQSLVESRRNDPLEWRLAYTAGYEAITAQLARWLFRKYDDWFDEADEHFAAMMTWHAAEEIEHRHVAFDVLRSVTPSYTLRARGLLAAIKKTLDDMVPVVTYMLEVDDYATRLDSKARRLKIRIDLAVELLPAILRYLAPFYHPSKDREPAGYAQWMRKHAAQEDAGIAQCAARAVERDGSFEETRDADSH